VNLNGNRVRFILCVNCGIVKAWMGDRLVIQWNVIVLENVVIEIDVIWGEMG
jgi:hypothetical protein